MIHFDQGNSLHLLLANLFDYAGMFPPAARSFEAALQETCSLAGALNRPWMVASDIVLDTEHAHKLRGVNLGAYSARNPFRVCVLATEDSERVREEATQLLKKEPPVTISSFEIKTSPSSLGETLEQYGSFCASRDILLCLEPNLSVDGWRDDLTATINTLRSSPFHPGLKCRLTGPTGISAERFAAAIIGANEGGIPLKVTGGLHHPIVEPTRYPFPMGFLNVSVGVMLHRCLGDKISAKALEEILTNQDARAFSFGERLGFKDLSVSINELGTAKAKNHFSVGSCSLHEPDEDLSRIFPSV